MDTLYTARQKNIHSIHNNGIAPRPPYTNRFEYTQVQKGNMTLETIQRMFWNGELSRCWMIMFVWSLTTGMFSTIPLWATHSIWFGLSIWLLVDSFILLTDLEEANRQLQKARIGLDIHTAARLDSLEQHIKAYILCADMRHALRAPPKYRTTRSHSE